MANSILTQARLKELLDYDPETGVFTNKVRRPGSAAGTVQSDGYVKVRLLGGQYYAHRLVWLYVHGEFPDSDLDHINRDRQDNRIENIRKVTRSENPHNRGLFKVNKSGFKGVSWVPRGSRWQAAIKVNHRSYHLGWHETLDSAVAARLRAERALVGSVYA